ncbi:hypothetical protein [Streptoalloteichus hindustanus]|nr:hypothetical protein [Streptoalloteichus hindustanus]
MASIVVTTVGLAGTGRVGHTAQMWSHWLLPLAVSLALLFGGSRLAPELRPRLLFFFACADIGALLARGLHKFVSLGFA